MVKLLVLETVSPYLVWIRISPYCPGEVPKASGGLAAWCTVSPGACAVAASGVWCEWGGSALPRVAAPALEAGAFSPRAPLHPPVPHPAAVALVLHNRYRRHTHSLYNCPNTYVLFCMFAPRKRSDGSSDQKINQSKMFIIYQIITKQYYIKAAPVSN